MNDSTRGPGPLRLDLASSILEFLQAHGAKRGDRLSERELARHLGVSRSPVRAALSTLVARNIVELKAGDGWFVGKLPKRAPGTAMTSGGELEELVFRIARDRYTGDAPQQFVESELVKRYKVGAAMMHKALIRLSQDGLVERSRGYGWRFLPMLDTQKSQRASYDLRLAIEPAGLVAEGFVLDEARLTRCKEEHQRLLAGGLAKAPANYLFEVNSNFHSMLAQFSGNEFFIQAIAHQNRLRRIVEYSADVDRARMALSCEEHLLIMDALESGDRAWAASLMERHLKSARKYLVASQGTTVVKR